MLTWCNPSSRATSPTPVALRLAIDYRGWGDSGGRVAACAARTGRDCARLPDVSVLDFIDRSSASLARFGVDWSLRGRVDERIKVNVGMVGIAHGFRAVTNRRTPEQMAVATQGGEARRKRVLTNEVDRCLRVMDVFIDDQSIAWEPAMGRQSRWRTRWLVRRALQVSARRHRPHRAARGGDDRDPRYDRIADELSRRSPAAREPNG
jgi:hypothetical protein